MINTLFKLDIIELQKFIDYFLFLVETKNIEKTIRQLGDIDSINGIGTYFIKPKNKIFNNIFLHTENNKIKSLSIGGSFEIIFQDLFDKYGFYSEVYIIHDEIFKYIFKVNDQLSLCVDLYQKINLDYSLKINNLELTYIEN